MIVSKANALAESRRLRGWSQALLAEKSAVSRTEVSAIETGRLVPSVAVALRLASALGQSGEAVFGGGGGDRETPSITWAWEPGEPEARRWWADVDGKLLAYPVEPTAAGTIPHDRAVPAADSPAGQRP